MKSLYRFGQYEANPVTRELLRQGVRIRLQEQPFRLLLLLLENSTEIVTRDRLRQELWSEDTFVEFENSLRVAIGKIRETLSGMTLIIPDLWPLSRESVIAFWRQ